MKMRPVTLMAPLQTVSDIYADRRLLIPGAGNEGLLHQWRLIYTVGGLCHTRTDQEDFTVCAGDMYLTQVRVWMSLQSQGPGDWDVAYAVFHPRPHWRTWLDALAFKDGLV